MIRRLIIYLFLLYSLSAAGQEQNLFDETHTIAFARHLYYSGQYTFAIDEFERALFFNNNNDSVKYYLLNSYLKAGKFNDGMNASLRLFPDRMFSDNRVILIQSKLLVATKSTALLEYAQTVKRDTLKTLMHMQSALQQADWKTAQQMYSIGVNQDQPLFEPFTQVIEQSKHVEHRSGFVAGAMSAIVPGSGKVYTGNWKDGAISLIMLSATSFQAIRGYNRNGFDSAKLWIFGTLSAGFYLGNIYGSAKSAQKFNRTKNDALIKKSRQIYLFLDTP